MAIRTPWAACRARPAAARFGFCLALSVSSGLCVAAPAFAQPTTTTTSATQAALQAQTLALSNLPLGWTATNGGANGGGTVQACRGQHFGAAGRLADAEASYEAPSGLPEFFEEISLYKATSTVFSKGVKTIDRCHTVALDQGGINLTIHVAKLAYPGGKKTAAFSLTFLVKGQKVGIDLVIEQVGTEVAQVSVADSPSPALSQVKQLVARAVHKITTSPVPTT